MAASWTDPRVRTLFSNKVLENLRAAHVWRMAFNKNFLGDVKGKGSTVVAWSFPDPTINDYDVPASDLSSQLITYQRLQATKHEITVDMDKDWAIAEDRIQDALSSPDAFDNLAENAGWAAADIMDRDLARRVNAAATAAGITGAGTNNAPIVGHGASDDMTAYAVMERIREEAKNNRVPNTKLHLFVPTWFMSIIRLDLRFSGFGTEKNRTTARGEEIIELAGITIHETINALDGAGTAFSTTPDSNDQNRIHMVWEGGATFVPFLEPGSMTDMIPASQNVLSHDNLLRSRFLWGAKITHPAGVLYQVVERGQYEA